MVKDLRGNSINFLNLIDVAINEYLLPYKLQILYYVLRNAFISPINIVEISKLKKIIHIYI